MKKKTILFVIDSLAAAGAEKSLVTLLNLLDLSKYNIDVQLFSYGGELEIFVPKEVNLLPPLDYSRFLSKHLLSQIFSFKFKKLTARIRYSLSIRKKGLIHADRARLYWKSAASVIPTTKHYNVAVAYAQGIPTFYVSDKANADIKLGWINVDYKLSPENKAFQMPLYERMNNVVAVSDAVYDFIKREIPELLPKTVTIWDIQDAQFMNKMAQEPCEWEIDTTVPVLLTIARLNKPQKGYDIALEACRILRDRGLKFHWYALGKGPYRPGMEEFIKEHNLEDFFTMLGTTPNPYPYIKAAKLYVQTSRHEGYGLTIAEARILNCPVVTTEFYAVYNQMVTGKNGLVVPCDPVAVADAVEKMLKDEDLYNSVKAYLETEKKGNTEEVEKFYKLIERQDNA